MTTHFVARPVAGSSFTKIACTPSLFRRQGGTFKEGSQNVAEVTCKRCIASPLYKKAVKAAAV